MNGGEIVAVFQCVQRRVHLALVVGVQIAVGALHMGVGQTHQLGDAPHQRHRADDGALLAILALEGGQLHGAARAPGPDHVGGQLAALHACPVDGMIPQNLVAQLHQAGDFLRIRAGGVVVADGLLQHVVGLGGMERRVRGHVRKHADMPEGAAHMHGEAGRLRRGMEAVVSQQVAHEGFGLVALHVAAVMAVDDETAVHLLHGAQVHPHGHLPRGEGHIHARGLQHAAPGVAGARVVAEDVQDGGVAACGNPRGDGLAQAGFAARKNAEVGQVEGFKGRFAPKGGNRVVAHAVADDQYIFHGITLLTLPGTPRGWPGRFPPAAPDPTKGCW